MKTEALNLWAPNQDFHFVLTVEESDKGNYYFAWYMGHGGGLINGADRHLIIPASIPPRIPETGLTYLDGSVNPGGTPWKYSATQYSNYTKSPRIIKSKLYQSSPITGRLQCVLLIFNQKKWMPRGMRNYWKKSAWSCMYPNRREYLRDSNEFFFQMKISICLSYGSKYLCLSTPISCKAAISLLEISEKNISKRDTIEMLHSGWDIDKTRCFLWSWLEKKPSITHIDVPARQTKRSNSNVIHPTHDEKNLGSPKYKNPSEQSHLIGVSLFLSIT